MANVATLTAKMAFDASGFMSGTKQAIGGLKSLQNWASLAGVNTGALTQAFTIGGVAGIGFAGAMTVVKTTLGVVTTAANAAKDALMWGAQLAADQEQAQVAFTTMMHSGERATAMLKDLEKFALSTPFDFPQARNSAKQLMAMGTSAKEIVPTMRTLGDIAAGVGVPMEQLTLVYGQVRAAGRLMGQDLRQLTSAGVGMIGPLAKEMGVAKTEVLKLMEQGKISFDTFRNAIIRLQETDFAGGMEAQSKTALGALNNLNESAGGLFKDLAMEIGNSLNATEWINDLAGFVGYVRQEWGPGIAGAFMAAANAIDEALAPLRMGLAHLMRSMAVFERFRGSIFKGTISEDTLGAGGADNAALLEFGANAIGGASFKQRAEQLQKFFKDHSIKPEAADGLKRTTNPLDAISKAYIGSGAKGVVGSLGDIFQDLGFAGGRVAGAFGRTAAPRQEQKPTGALRAGSSEAFSAIIAAMTGRDRNQTAKESLQTLKAIEKAAGKQIEVMTEMLKNAAGGLVTSFSG